MRKSLWIMLAILLAVIAAPNAHADSVTLDVSGSLTPSFGAASCSVSGCTLGGDIVINDTTGAIISEDVTVSGESPTVGPFTNNIGIVAASIPPSGNTVIQFSDGISGDSLRLVLTTSTAGSLKGYGGGPLTPLDGALESLDVGVSPSGWSITSGALTPTAAPEPSSYALMLLGVGLVFVMRKRMGQGLPQAS